MAHATFDPTADWPTWSRVLVVATVLELFLLVAYFLGTGNSVRTPRYVLYPFLWINVAIVAVVAVRPRRASRRHRLLAAAVAGAYFLLLANWSGLVGLTTTGHHAIPESVLGLTIGQGSPGWQRVRFITPLFNVQFIPYRVIGYLGLTYLVYVAVIDATGAVLSGALGFLSCLSCSFPIVAAAITSIWGGSTTLMGSVYAHSVDISTATFLLSAALLYWRPGFRSVREKLPGSDGE
ncbi:MAG: hypothetical protein ABEJ85_06300 [Haloarculaceae archaeon]